MVFFEQISVGKFFLPIGALESFEQLIWVLNFQRERESNR